MTSAEASMDQIRERRAQYTTENVGIFLQACPVEYVLARLDKADKLIFIFWAEGSRGEILWDIPREIDRVFTNQVHSVRVAPNV